MEKVKLKDIAEAAGVRPSTVSLVLREQPKAQSFTRETRERILNIAADMGFFADRPRTPAGRQLRTIAFLLAGEIQDGWNNGFFVRFLNGIEEACREMGYNLEVMRCHASEFDEPHFPSRNHQRSVDGVVVTGYISEVLLRKIHEMRLPCVCLGEDLAGNQNRFPIFCVNAVGMYLQIIRYLHSMNHCRIIALMEEREHQLALGDELKEILSRTGEMPQVEFRVMVNDSNYSDFRNGSDFLWRLVNWDDGPKPTAVICNERVGIGILRALPKFNLRCPEDLSIVIAGDGPMCDVSFPPLSAVAIDCEEIGYQATRTLISHLRQGKPVPFECGRSDFPTRLNIRGSIRALELSAKSGQSEQP